MLTLHKVPYEKYTLSISRKSNYSAQSMKSTHSALVGKVLTLHKVQKIHTNLVGKVLTLHKV
jgi:hypothetical protein